MNNLAVQTPIIVALDFSSAAPALNLARSLDPKLCRLKVGKELFTACGPKIIEDLQKLGFAVFLDLKFHDIPTTCAKAVIAAANLGVWMLNVHLSGGLKMLEACRSALDKSAHKPLLIGVSVLTSMNTQDLAQIGVKRDSLAQVMLLADLAKQAKFDGLVCSALEASMLKQEFASFKLVTPGIRPNNSSQDDQNRVLTPIAAIKAGSDYLVIGRPITQAGKPEEALNQIIASLNV